MENIIIAVDAMGGDNAPDAMIEGCALALRSVNDISVRLFGRRDIVEPLLQRYSDVLSRVELIDAPDVITMHDEPMLAIRRKKESSMVMGFTDVKEGRSQALVSAGSTGALFLGGMAYLRIMRGIDRPALGMVMPGLNKPFLLMDVGANADCQPKYLMQFGLMGSVFMKNVMNVPEPSVGLVNIGAEAEKGNKLTKEAYQMMDAQNVYHFAGNCEARDVQYGNFDVVVCDGFTGNIILKYAEGFSSFLLHKIKSSFMSSLRGKLGGLIVKPLLKGLKRELNPDEYGGSLLMGLEGTVVKAHGSSNAYAFSRALLQARSIVQTQIAEHIREGLNTIQSQN